MANKDAPFGARPIGHLAGGIVRATEYHIADALAENIYYGDFVGREDKFASREDRDISAHTAAWDPIGTEHGCIGVFAGCTYRADDDADRIVFSRHWPSGVNTVDNAGAVAYVYDDPFIIYEIQGSGTGALTDIGKTADIIYTAGNLLTGVSSVELLTPGSDNNLFIYDYLRDGENTLVDTNPIYHVLIAEHHYRNAGVQSFTAVT